MEAHFILLQAKGNPKKFSIKRGQTLIIGRSATDANIVVDDDLCSSKHCKLSFELNRITIEDLNSKNGLFLNGKRIQRQEIELNDKFEFGKMTLYLNTKLMKTTTKSVDSTYKGYVEGEGNLTFEDGRVAANQRVYDGKTRTMMSKRNFEKNRKRESLRPKSKMEIAILSFIVQMIDFILGILIFFLIITLAVKSNPELIKLSHKFNFIKLLFMEQMYVYTGASALVALMLYNVNKKLPKGSIGERLLKIRK